MTPARSLVIAMVAMVLLIGARPLAGVPQFPRGLMASADPRAPSRSCTIETRPLSFGTYDPLAERDLDAIGQIIYTCENGNGGGSGRAKPENKGIRIEMAQGASNSFSPRHMFGPGFADLEYNIYLDSTHRQVWGTGEGPTLAYVDSHPPNGTPVTVPAFARIFAGQDVTWGPYTDTVPVRILF